jgi:hypothetical protein
VLKAFQKAKLLDCELIFFGNGLTLENLKLKLLCWNKKNITLMGFEQDLLESNKYKSIDVVIRGDANFVGLGRSGFEALANRKIIVIPKDDNILHEKSETNNNPIQKYLPRNHESLKSTILKIYETPFEHYDFDLIKTEDSMLWTQDKFTYSKNLKIIYEKLNLFI